MRHIRWCLTHGFYGVKTMTTHSLGDRGFISLTHPHYSLSWRKVRVGSWSQEPKRSHEGVTANRLAPHGMFDLCFYRSWFSPTMCVLGMEPRPLRLGSRCPYSLAQSSSLALLRVVGIMSTINIMRVLLAGHNSPCETGVSESQVQNSNIKDQPPINAGLHITAATTPTLSSSSRPQEVAKPRYGCKVTPKLSCFQESPTVQPLP